MREESGFSMRKHLNNTFFPFKRKSLNIASYVGIGILSLAGACICEQDYTRDLQRYEAGEISREPQYSDYSPVGRLEKWLSND